MAGQPGVAQVSVNLATERVHIVLAPGDMAEDTPARLRRAIRDAGYGVRVEAAPPKKATPSIGASCGRCWPLRP